LPVLDKTTAGDAQIASGEEREEIGIAPQIEGVIVIGKSHEVPRWSNAWMQVK
jgi:hypothetical protein